MFNLKMKFIYLSVAIVWCVRGEPTPVYNSSDIFPQQTDDSSLVFQNKCIEDLGCFYTGPPWYDPVNRPISVPPTDIKMTRFELFTPTNPQEAEILETTEKSIEDSSFNPKFPIEVVIHGFRVDLDENAPEYKTKDAFLKFGDFNVIIVNWSKDNKFPFSQAVANTRAVGAKLAKLLKIIMNVTGLSAQSIHLIGKSLGAHIAGYAGKRIPNLGRISGLDPARPFFEVNDTRVRLDITDALFLDTIDTNAAIEIDEIPVGRGFPVPIGHQAFFVNGGRVQPGCIPTLDDVSKIVDNDRGVIDTIAEVNTCSHDRSELLFKESIDDSRCRFLGVLCDTYFAFRFGECTPQNSTVAEMGFHAKPIEGLPEKSKFYLSTNEEEPFCIQNQYSTEE